MTNGRVLAITVPFLRYALENHGTSLPGYAEGHITGSPYNNTLVLHRPGREIEPVTNLEVLKVREYLKFVEISSGGDGRTIVLFENAFGNGELLIASKSGHFLVRGVTTRGKAIFQRETFKGGKYFWKRLNSQLDRPFIHRNKTAFSRVRFPKLDAKNERANTLELQLGVLCVRILQAVLPDSADVAICVKCGTRRTAATAAATVFVSDKHASNVDPEALALASELAQRLVVSMAPYSERAQSLDPNIGCWTTREEAIWVPKEFRFAGAPIRSDLSAIERALILPELCRDLEAMGVRCNDLFEAFRVS